MKISESTFKELYEFLKVLGERAANHKRITEEVKQCIIEKSLLERTIGILERESQCQP